MEHQEEIIRWNNIFKKNKFFKKDLKKIEKTGILDSSFFGELSVIDFSIFGKYGIGFGKINAVTAKKIIDSFFNVFSLDKNGYFLISSDGSNECVEIVESVTRINDNNINFLSFSDFEGFDKKFVSFCVKKLGTLGAIHISKSIFDKDIININIYNKNGSKINNESLKEILRQVKNTTEDINYKNDNSNVSFLNNEMLIRMFVDKISTLFTKNSTIKKTKIAISNRSQGISTILSKLIGNQDFSYVINNKVNKKRINIFEKKHINNWVIKWVFWKEIFFAKKEKANFLVAFNKEGTQLFLFLFYGWKIIYLNEDMISLIFLHKFYNDIVLENKKIPEVFVASNGEPNKNLMTLFRKYKIDFRKIQDNNFSFKDYMLLYWNDHNQSVFGEKINDEFTIYHLFIKIVGVVDYFNNQYSSVNALFNNMKKMYGKFENEDKFFFNISKEKINQLISDFVNSENGKKHVISSTKNEEYNEEIIENDLWKIELKTGHTIFVKYNLILKKTIVKIRYQNSSKEMLKYMMNNFQKKLLIKKISLNKKN